MNNNMHNIQFMQNTQNLIKYNRSPHQHHNKKLNQIGAKVEIIR